MSHADPLLITDTDINGVLKNVYAKFRINSFPLATPLLAQVKKATPGGPERLQWGGNGVYFDVKLTPPVGFTASTGGYFPPTAKVVEKQANLGIKRTYVTRTIDALADQGTQSKEAAFENLGRAIIDEALEAAQLGQQFCLQGNGLGILGTISTVNSTTSIVVTDPYGISGAGEGGLWLFQDKYVAVLDSTGVTVRGKAFVNSVTNSGDNCTAVLASAISGMQATDIVVDATTTDHSYNAVPQGLASITNRGNAYQSFQGLSSGTYPRWDAVRMTASDLGDGTNPTEMDGFKMIRRLKGRSGKDAQMNPGQFLSMTTTGIMKKIGESMLGQRNWEMGAEELKGGFKGVRVCGVPLVVDDTTPAGTWYLLHLPSLTWVDRMDWQKISYEGSGPWRFVPGQDANTIHFGAYWNFGALQRNAHASITGITDTERYTWVV